MTPQFAGTERFEIIRPLGRGGMGIVFEALDREQNTTCALKLLPRATPRALLRFKHEFRVLQGLHHPNLVTLGELLNDGEHWFFTMELVNGVDLLTYVTKERGEAAPLPMTATVTLSDAVSPLRHAASDSANDVRAPSNIDETRLREVLSQLAAGLRFLHEAGKVHRDIKPANVLVEPDGRVVILDFGLVANLADLDVRESGLAARMASGTPGYMAPEQILDEDVGPPADLYAMGAVLFRAITGAAPSFDAGLRSALVGGARSAPRPSALVPCVPRLLDDLCVELLDPNPAARPTARDVLARLGVSENEPEARELSAPFVGRREELSQLSHAYEDSSKKRVVVVLDGPSGIGKTALVGELLRALRAREEAPLVLTGRCYEHEGIPYKAIDGVMDALGDTLTRAPANLLAALPANVALLSVLFPALRRVPALSGSAWPTELEGSDTGHAYDMRRGAERALRLLFAELVAWRPLIVAIDDFQWSDPDSVTFLSALTTGPDAPPFLLLLSSRTPHDLPFGDEIRTLSLAPLPPEDARELAARLLANASSSVTTSADIVAAEGGGNPFFVNELALQATVRAGAPARLEDVLWERISTSHGASRRVLELVAVAAAPIMQKVVAEAAALDAGALARATQDLRAKRLVRTTGLHSDDLVETHHDRIRETVVAKLDRAARVATHLRLGEALERLRPDDLDSLVTHFEGGGDGERAAVYAVRAGDQAARALAFERAAAFYRRARERLPVERSREQHLSEKLADALANAGLGPDAAREYQRAAEHSDPTLALELRRRAAEHLLRSGHLDEGLVALGDLLERLRVPMPRTPVRGFASMLFRRGIVRMRGLSFTERRPEDVADADLFRVDTLWAAAARLGPIDPIGAADFQARHLLSSLELGEPFRVARALLAEATFIAMGGPSQSSRMEGILARARPIVAKVARPYATAMQQFVEGFADYQFGRYARGLEGLSRASELFRTTCTGASHDVAVSDRFALDSLFHLGNMSELSSRAALLLNDAERRGDLFLAAELRTGLPNIVWLCSDRPAEARRSNALGIAPWSRKSFYLQHYYHALAGVHIALYEGDGEGAHRIIEEAWRSLRGSLLLHVQAVRIEALYLRTRAAIAEGSTRALAVAEKTLRKVAAEQVPSASGLAAAARAGLAARRGKVDEALALLRTAERSLARHDIGICAAACRFHLGNRGREPGAARTKAEAEAWMRERGVVRPDRFADLMIPGFGLWV